MVAPEEHQPLNEAYLHGKVLGHAGGDFLAAERFGARGIEGPLTACHCIGWETWVVYCSDTGLIDFGTQGRLRVGADRLKAARDLRTETEALERDEGIFCLKGSKGHVEVSAEEPALFEISRTLAFSPNQIGRTAVHVTALW